MQRWPIQEIIEKRKKRAEARKSEREEKVQVRLVVTLSCTVISRVMKSWNI